MNEIKKQGELAEELTLEDLAKVTGGSGTGNVPKTQPGALDPWTAPRANVDIQGGVGGSQSGDGSD